MTDEQTEKAEPTIVDVQTALRNVETAKSAVLVSDPGDEDTLTEKVKHWQDANKALGESLSNVDLNSRDDKDVTTDTTVATDGTAPVWESSPPPTNESVGV